MRSKDPARFWAKVDRSSGPCWEWLAAMRNPDSYGLMQWGGRLVSAHRIAWELAHGSIPDGLWVLHHCDNRKCVRPDPLFLGTHNDNMADARRKHRMSEGDAHYTRRNPMLNGKRRFAPEAIREMRAAYAAGESQMSLARRYGWDQANIRRAVLRISYAWVD